MIIMRTIIFLLLFFDDACMIFVETNNYREQLILEEEFTREDNLFAIPITKIGKIRQIIAQIKSEIFGVGSALTSLDGQQKMELSQMCSIMDGWVQNSFRLQFSLSTLRQIYHMIELQAGKIAKYKAFCLKLNNYLQDSENEMENQRDNFVTTQKSITPNQTDCLTDLSKVDSSPKKVGHCSEFCLQEINTADSQLTHSLRSQLPYSPKFIMTRFADGYNADLITNKFGEEQNLVDVQNSASKLRNSQKSKKQLKKIKTILSTQQSEPRVDPYASLSGRVNPIPSFLHYEDVFGDMIAKQKKQDIRKSKIIHSEIKNLDSFKEQSQNPRNYTDSIRAIKLNNKLRKNSRKSISNKVGQLEPMLTDLVHSDKQKQQKFKAEIPQKSSTNQIKKSSSKKNYRFFKEKV